VPNLMAGQASAIGEIAMAESLHPVATHHLPMFITAPGDTDVLMVGMAWFLLLATLMVGILFFRLHTLPERIAHRGHKLQFEIVAVLGLISLFTHQHIFWIAGLLLALIDIPDFSGSLGRIAGSVEKIAGVKPGEGAADVPNDIFVAPSDHAATTAAPPEAGAEIKRGDGTPPPSPTKRPELVPASTRS
jgi:hypothetical protein